MSKIKFFDDEKQLREKEEPTKVEKKGFIAREYYELGHAVIKYRNSTISVQQGDRICVDLVNDKVTKITLVA